jgi:ribosomal protein L7/L12
MEETMTINVTVIPTAKLNEPVRHVNLLDTDVAMLKDIRDKVGLIQAIKVCRLLIKDCGLKDAMDYVRGL